MKEFEKSHLGLEVTTVNFKPISFVKDSNKSEKNNGESQYV